MYGPLVRIEPRNIKDRTERVQVVVEDSNVDEAIRDMDLLEFSSLSKMLERLIELFGRVGRF